MTTREPRRGEVWQLDFSPTLGHEQAGVRPALVLSVDDFNASAAGLIVALPITSRDKHIRSHVPVRPPEGGLRVPSFVKCEEPRTVARERLRSRLGAVGAATLESVEVRVRWLLGL
jgi:mRNA interferase MazF